VADYKLKDFFGTDVVTAIARDITAVHPAFNHAGFSTEALTGLNALELLPRGWHIAEALHKHLPKPFPDAAAILTASLPPEIPATGTNGMAPFKFLPHVFYVQKYGLDHFDAAMDAQDALTRRFSCESSIRPYLDRFPDQTLARLGAWAIHENAHLRRHRAR
jgi:3-methyladenine DNA glycosylase AlkC